MATFVESRRATQHNAGMLNRCSTLQTRPASSEGAWYAPRHSYRLQVSAVTLVELLVVLAIIGIMLSLLLPALMSARSRAVTTQCQNNVRQVGLAMRGHLQTAREFPPRDQWTIKILKWMEEWPLADRLEAGIPADSAEARRPRLFRCPAQDDVESIVAGVNPCHYVLSIRRPPNSPPRPTPKDIRWEIHDREALSEVASLQPWYRGSEMTWDEQTTRFAEKLGPHPSGVFYTHAGQSRGGVGD